MYHFSTSILKNLVILNMTGNKLLNHTVRNDCKCLRGFPDLFAHFQISIDKMSCVYVLNENFRFAI